MSRFSFSVKKKGNLLVYQKTKKVVKDFLCSIEKRKATAKAVASPSSCERRLLHTDHASHHREQQLLLARGEVVKVGNEVVRRLGTARLNDLHKTPTLCNQKIIRGDPERLAQPHERREARCGQTSLQTTKRFGGDGQLTGKSLLAQSTPLPVVTHGNADASCDVEVVAPVLRSARHGHAPSYGGHHARTTRSNINGAGVKRQLP